MPGTSETFALLLDDRFVDSNSCYLTRRVPLPVVRTNQRSFHTIQRTALPSGSALRLSPYTVRLGDSPVVMVAQPLLATGAANEFSLTREMVSFGPAPERVAIETRLSKVTLTLDAATASATLTVWSSYSCVDAGPTLRELCPRQLETPAPDAVSCEVTMAGRVHRLQ